MPHPPPARPVARAGAALAAAALALFAVVAVTVLRSDGQDRLDRTLHHDLVGRGGGAAVDLAGVLATPAVVVVVTLVAVVVLWRGVHRPLLGAGLLAEAVATTALVQLLALALSGVRPSSTVLLGLPLFDGSFPSVRTASAVALWGGLALAGVLLARGRAGRAACAAAGLVLTGAVAWGQLDRTHVWPTDVLGGWLLGVAAVGVAAALLPTWPVLPDVGRAGAPAGRRRAGAGTTLGR